MNVLWSPDLNLKTNCRAFKSSLLSMFSVKMESQHQVYYTTSKRQISTQLTSKGCNTITQEVRMNE